MSQTASQKYFFFFEVDTESFRVHEKYIYQDLSLPKSLKTIYLDEMGRSRPSCRAGSKILTHPFEPDLKTEDS